LFRASVRRGGNEQIAAATARQLLATNRLLLDSPAAQDDRTRLLLQDLELVLAQIAQLSPRPSSPDLDLITEGLDDGGVMSRLRTAVPSGASTTQGVL
jgi:ubiquinone biosynthesis protein UbiJ